MFAGRKLSQQQTESKGRTTTDDPCFSGGVPICRSGESSEEFARSVLENIDSLVEVR